MASRRRSSKKSDSSFWSDRFPRVVNSCLLVCVLFNFVALAWGVKSSSPKVVHHLDSVTTNHYFVVTQFVASVSAPSSVLESKSVDVVQNAVGHEIPVKYHYMEVDGAPLIRYYGRNLSVGDIMSYGRIVSIFPDRVALDGSIYLRNTDNPDELENRRIVKNE